MMDDWTQNHFYILLPYPAKAPNKPSLIHMDQSLVSIKRFYRFVYSLYPLLFLFDYLKAGQSRLIFNKPTVKVQ